MNFIKSKKGISVIIGYVLLIAVVVAMSLIVYQWIKSYVPQDALTCPDGISVSIPSYIYNCTTNTFNFTLGNDGTFSIAGYFIRATNSSTQTVATIDLSPYYTGVSNHFNGVLFSYYNVFDPGKQQLESINGFNLSISPIFNGTINKIEVTPTRFVEYKGKNRFASCGGAKISELITCTS